MLQNPHRYQHGGHRKTREPGRATQLGARLRCPRAAAGPGRTTSRRTKPTSTTPSPTGEEGTARPESQGELRDSGPGCGARGRRRGLAEQRADAPSQPAPHQAPPVRRAPEDPEGTDGLRGAALQGNTAQARGRSGRDPDHQRDIKQHPHARDPSARVRTSLGHNKAAHGHTPLGHDKAARPHRGRAAVAVALGFEPRVAVTPHSISSAAPSAARTRYLTRTLYYTAPRTMQIDRARWEQGHTTPRGPTAPHDEGPSIGDD